MDKAETCAWAAGISGHRSWDGAVQSGSGQQRAQGHCLRALAEQPEDFQCLHHLQWLPEAH